MSDLPRITQHMDSTGVQVLTNNDMIDLRQSIDTKKDYEQQSTSFMTPGHLKTKSAINFGLGHNFNQPASIKSQMTAANSLFARNHTGVDASPQSFGLLSKRKKLGTMANRTNTFLSQSNLK